MPESSEATGAPDGWTCAAPSEALKDLRRRIDAVDAELLALLNRRAVLSLEVGKVKAGTSGPVFRPQREREVLDTLARANPGPLPEEHLRSIWHEIFASSRVLQRPVSVAYLGPEGTNSYFAAVDLLGRLMDYRPYKNFREAFAAVHGGDCALGVIPLENVLQGSVGQCFDLFMEYEVYIQAEAVCRIQHTLLSGESSLGAVRVVYSHPQALAQCQRWLRQHLPEAALIACDSTAAAARRAAEEPHSAAIGHKSLSTMLGLPILTYNLEDEPTNQTRFVVIGPKPTDSAGSNKTSILFTLPDQPGSLAGILEVLFKAGVNLRKLESRPLRAQRWKYAFFADLETNLLKPELSGVLAELRNTCHSFRLLGCYMAGE